MNQLSRPDGVPVHKERSDASDVITLEAVNYVYDNKTPWAHVALQDISLTIKPGDRLLVVGENGSGKSTLAWILAGLFKPTNGQALRNDQPLADQVSSLGLLIQHTRLQLLCATVGEEFDTFGIKADSARSALGRMGLSPGFYTRRLDEMSVGQQRRVGLAILFARKCPVVILDEPLAGLDRTGATLIANAVAMLPPSMTLLTVTHDIEASSPLGTDAIRLERGSITERSQL